VTVLDRIRAEGGKVVRSEWQLTLVPGRMTTASMAWVRSNKDALLREIWPEFDDWSERAAIMEYDAGLTRSEAEAAAYRRVMKC
jgi:hypothetical protein